MSWYCSLVDPVTKETLTTPSTHFIQGSTYCQYGSDAMELNITYNYGKIFRKVIDPENGINSLNEMGAVQAIPILQKAIDSLKDDGSDDYWEATEGNAKRALYGLLAFSQMRPDGMWIIEP